MDPALDLDEQPLDVLGSAAERLLATVPADVWCAVLLDPSTMLDTGGIHANGFPPEVMPRLFEIEHVEQDDVDNIRSLRDRGATASLLSASTRGDVSTSKYYRDVLRPCDMADELRVLLRDGSRIWGLLVLCRAEGTQPFGSDAVRRAAQVGAAHIDPLRRSLLLAGRDQAGLPDAPGLVVIGPDLDITWASDDAERWLARMTEQGRRSAGACPYAMRALAVRSRALPEGTPARTRVPDLNGGWLTLRAWTTRRGDDLQTTVSIGPAEVGDLMAMILDVYGLTPRERDVAQQVILGRSTADAARALEMSAYTVQDHLKAVFRKTGVNSRGQLTAKLFFECYLPQLAATPLSRDGRLVQGSS